MAKRKRGVKEEERPRERLYITNLGLPEVDGIIHRLRLKLPPLRIPFEKKKDKKKSPPNSEQKGVISKLPDEILQFIVSNLSTREGAATCILSTRWRSVWTTSVSGCLNFDIHNMVGHDYPEAMFMTNPRGIATKASQRLLKNIRSEFIQWVDRVLQLRLRRSSRLDALRVCFVLNKGSTPHIERWIKSAAAHGVTDMELSFNSTWLSGFILEYPELEFPPAASASSLKYLRLSECIFRLPPDFTGFTSLISLSLCFLEVTQYLIDTILSKCPLLECLSLTRITYYSNTPTLTFSGPSLVLKHLSIWRATTDPGINKIQVHDLNNLLSFELKGSGLPKLSIKNAPLLARLVYSVPVPVIKTLSTPVPRLTPVIETLSNVPRLAILFLRLQIKDLSIIPQSYTFGTLKKLVFVIEDAVTSLLGVVHLIEACHLLQELELNMGYLPTWEGELTETLTKLTMVPQIYHNNLKQVEMYGFEARPERIKFAKYLLNYAIVLEKMKIYTTGKVYNGNGKWILREGSTKEVKSLNRVGELLRKAHKIGSKSNWFTLQAKSQQLWQSQSSSISNKASIFFSS